jgi:hypothetical protein
VLRDARLSDLETELEQLAMMRGAPHNGFSALTYRVNLQLRFDLRPAPKGAGFPTPVPAEAGSVPSHDGHLLRFAAWHRP